jgi:hypothetical protein
MSDLQTFETWLEEWRERNARPRLQATLCSMCWHGTTNLRECPTCHVRSCRHLATEHERRCKQPDRMEWAKVMLARLSETYQSLAPCRKDEVREALRERGSNLE